MILWSSAMLESKPPESLQGRSGAVLVATGAIWHRLLLTHTRQAVPQSMHFARAVALPSDGRSTSQTPADAGRLSMSKQSEGLPGGLRGLLGLGHQCKGRLGAGAAHSTLTAQTQTDRLQHGWAGLTTLACMWGNLIEGGTCPAAVCCALFQGGDSATGIATGSHGSRGQAHPICHQQQQARLTMANAYMASSSPQ